MESLKALFAASPILALFVCVALGYAIAKIKIGKFRIGGIVGTLFAAIVVGQVGVEVNEQIKTIAFALFIYSLGFVSGPQFFSSLGRSTIAQVHLSVFCGAVVFTTVWAAAQIFGLDKGTAAGLLAGATTESASVGTATETLANMGLDSAELEKLQANIGVTYAVTYLFGFTLVVFFVSAVAPRMMGVDLEDAARALEKELGDVGENLDEGQEEALRQIVGRVFEVTLKRAVGKTVSEFERQHDGDVTIQQIRRNRRDIPVTPDVALAMGDRIALLGKRDATIAAGDFLGKETGDVRGMGFVGETRDVVLTNPELIGATVQDAKRLIDPDMRRGVYATKLTRVEHAVEMRPRTRLQAGDVITIYGASGMVETAAARLGYALQRGEAVDYIYLGLGIIAGILIGMISIPIAGSPVSLHTGGGCLISGLVFGWLRSKRPTFGSLPSATALHLRDFGLSIFVACVGLAVGPQAVSLLAEKGVLLPILAIVVVLIPLISSMYYARYVLKMNPVVICGALAGLLTCTAGLNAVVAEAKSESPVLGYTVPYAIANVVLTLLGPVIVLIA